MSKHSLVKTSLGVGLMAASLGASADIHTFAEPMLFYKVNGAQVNYTAFVPSLLTSSVLFLEMYQSGTISTWAYGLGGAVNAAAGGAAWSVSATADSTGTLQFNTLDPLGAAHTHLTATKGAFSSSWYGGDTAGVSLSFTQQQTVSSQACNVTFSATIDTADYMQYVSFTIKPTDWPSATDSVTYRTKSGTVVGDTASVGSAAWNLYNASATTSFYTFSAFTIPVVGNAAQTYAASQMTKFNLCTTAYTSKSALNSAGSTIGGRAGLMRLW